LAKKFNNQIRLSENQFLNKIEGLQKEVVKLKTEQTSVQEKINEKRTTLSEYGITDAAPIANPALTGTPTAPTPSDNDQSTRIATTAFVAKAAVTVAPPGTIMFFASQVAPEGWLKANGFAVDNIIYKDLDAAIYVGDAENNAAAFGYRCTDENNPDSTRSALGRFIVLPDLRAEFLRGWDDGRGIDGNRYLGAWQKDAFRSHTHSGLTDSAGEHIHSAQTDEQGAHQHTGTTTWNGDHTHDIRRVSHSSHGYLYGVQRYRGEWAHGFDPKPMHGIYPENIPLLMTNAGGHDHTFHTTSDGNHNHKVNIDKAGEHIHRFSTSSTGGVETRPRNVALLACIKY